MESPKPGETDAGSTARVPEAAISSEFLTRFLRRKPETAEIEDDDDDSESTKPSKRWRRFWSKLFTSVATPEPIVAPKNREERATVASLFVRDCPAPVEAESNNPDTEYLQDNEAAPQADERRLSPAVTEQTAEPVITDPLLSAPQAEQMPMAQANQQEYTYSPVNNIPGELKYRAANEYVPTAGDTRIKAPAEKRTNYAEQSAERAERRAGLTSGLVVLESLGRRRADKQLEKRVIRTEQAVRRVERQQVPIEASQRPLTQPEFRAGHIENVSVLPHKSEKQVLPISSHIAEQEEKVRIVEAYEQPPERLVFERVVEAAEADKPIEKLYERRHEIKDAAPVQSAAGGATAIGLVAAQKIEAATLTAADRKKLAKAVAKSQDELSASPYKQAAKSGFWTAVVMVAAAAAVLLIR